MFNLFALLFGKMHVNYHSFFIKIILKSKGIKVGKNFVILGIPYLKIQGVSKNINIGDNVFIGGDIDLRNRENGQIIIGNNVKIDDNCRFVAANDATLLVGDGSAFGPRCIFNAGEDVKIGEKVLLSGGVYINSSAHEIKRNTPVRDQGYYHEKVFIGDDVFIGANVVINPGVVIEKGTIVGANAVVTKNTKEYSINAGVPAKKIGERV